MKNKISQLLKTFVITLFVAFIATNQDNYVYNFFDKLGYENEILKKTVLSALIALFIGLLSILISYLWSKIKSNFKKMKITFNTKLNGSKRATIKFEPKDYEYSQEEIEIEISLEPGGWISNLLIKKLGISLDVYFNPELLDIYFLDKWDTDTDGIFRLSDRKISINLLEKMEIRGRNFKGTTHKLKEQFEIKPIRVKNAETTLDLFITSKRSHRIGRLIDKYFLTTEFDSLKVTCKGE
ncbi:hypothetical protein [Paucisalibacillus globulus]|uniref:hypothetical protein n=1 Tax=Paucisalibacillus globulus TaxID=351095 RepID=UPI000BB6E5C6|nr:hypothetical protein [Paucisalibacillus globulus]